MSKQIKRTVSPYKPLKELNEEFQYHPRFIPRVFCEYFCQVVEDLFPEERSKITVFGKTHDVPRDQVVMGQGYSYSGHKVKVVDWVEDVSNIKELLEDLEIVQDYKLEFDTVLINGYNGVDKVGWHSDDESTLDKEKPIISVSFGDDRDFDVRLISDKKQKWRQTLSNGDVVVMMPGVQQKYQHQVPPRKKAKRRYNLTFRIHTK